MAKKQTHLPESEALEQCLKDIATGSQEAFEELYHRTSSGIYAFALSLVKNAHDAQDIMHDTYLRVYSAAPAYQSNGTPMAWILTITRNLCYNHLNDRKRIAEIAPDEWDLHLPPVEDSAREDRIALTEGLKILTDEERQIVILHAVSDLKHKQIAELLNLPLSTVLSKYRRSIQKLEKNL